jgi:hypothetical protein
MPIGAGPSGIATLDDSGMWLEITLVQNKSELNEKQALL